MEKKRSKSVDPQLSPKYPKELKPSPNRAQPLHDSVVEAFNNRSPVPQPKHTSDDMNHNDWTESSTAEETGEETETDVDEYDRNIRQEILSSQRRKSDSRERFPTALYEEDYTDSTESNASESVSASIESMEQFLNSVRSASTSTTNIRSAANDELETYHPRMEVVRTLSPQRIPEPGQAAVILNKPLPLPDPDYVPKPILKRPAEITTNEKSNELIAENSISKAPLKKPEEKKPEKEKHEKPEKPEKPEKVEKDKPEKRGFLNLFGKKTPSSENLRKSLVEAKPLPQTPKETVLTAPPKPVEAEKNKKVQLRQNSMEENKVAIDHYSDLVRELGGGTRPKVPLYLDSDALRAAAERAEWEEQQETLRVEREEREAAAHRARAQEEEEERKRVQELTLKLKQYQDISPSARSRSSSFQKDMVEISVEQTKSITYSLREIKQDDVSGTNDHRKAIDNISASENLAPSTTTLSRVKVSPVRQHSESIASRRSHSRSPARQHRTSLTSTVLRVTRMPIENNIQNIDINISRSESPESESEPRCQTPDQIQAEAETNVKSTISYVTDLAMFAFACWLYLFKDARLAIPVLALMIYRQARMAIERKLQKWKKWKRS